MVNIILAVSDVLVYNIVMRVATKLAAVFIKAAAFLIHKMTYR